MRAAILELFMRSHASRVVALAVTVIAASNPTRARAAGEDAKWPHGRWPQQEALYKQFDWAALKKMVNP
jgi:hypothetical protein